MKEGEARLMFSHTLIAFCLHICLCVCCCFAVSMCVCTVHPLWLPPSLLMMIPSCMHACLFRCSLSPTVPLPLTFFHLPSLSCFSRVPLLPFVSNRSFTSQSPFAVRTQLSPQFLHLMLACACVCAADAHFMTTRFDALFDAMCCHDACWRLLSSVSQSCLHKVCVCL